MHTLYKLRACGGMLARIRMSHDARKFMRSTLDCRKTQQQVFRRVIGLNSESRFSREHGLHAGLSLQEFRNKIPIADFDAYRPYVERMKQGHQNELLGPKNPLLMFTLSSGTTSESKFIPITKPFLEDYRAGWQIWGIHAFSDHPQLFYRNIVQLSSDYDQFRTPGGTPCGNISGLVIAMQRPIVKFLYTIPGLVSKISDPDLKYYTALRLSLADKYVGLVTTSNPSTLLRLAKLADQEKESLIRDIADGTLTSSVSLDPSIQKKLRRKLTRRRPKRAKELERIVEQTGHLYPKDFWPFMELISVWTGGSAGAYLSLLPEYFGSVPIRDHGLSASEGRMTIPLEDNTPSGVLDVNSNFFEFIPEAEYGTNQPTVLEAHELEPDQNYYILLTTTSGLYRYDICDVVRCTGYFNSTPTLEFLHKGAHISNITGEKISESQVVTAVKDCTSDLPIHLGDFTLTPVWSEPPYYQLLVEQGSVVSRAIMEHLISNLDTRLQELNVEYHDKRKTGRLAQLQYITVPAGSWDRFSKKRQSGLGGSVEQYKHPCLVPDMEFTDNFIRDFAA